MSIKVLAEEDFFSSKYVFNRSKASQIFSKLSILLSGLGKINFEYAISSSSFNLASPVLKRISAIIFVNDSGINRIICPSSSKKNILYFTKELL